MKNAAIVVTLLCFALPLFAKTDNVFRFVVLGDRTAGAVDEVFEEIIDEVRLLDPDFVMCVGDIAEVDVGDSTEVEAEFDRLVAVVNSLPCKFYWCAGNNDISQESDRARYEAKTGFKRYYSFNYQNSHFVVLDDALLTWPAQQTLDPEQQAWLVKDLEKHKQMDNIFVFYHIPTYIYAVQDGVVDSMTLVFEKYGVDMVFTGHHHEYSYSYQGSTDYINVGSSGGGISTNDPARGHFLQYLMVTVRGTQRTVAVMKKESALPHNIVTLGDIGTINRLDEEAVTMTDLMVDDDAKGISQTVAVTIENFGPDSILNPLVWQTDQSRYTITPSRMPLAIAPEEKKECAFDVRIADGSDLFPIPRFTMAYPFTYGKVCTLYNLLSVKRHKYVETAASPPAIDGKLDDPLWRGLVPITCFANYDGSSQAITEKTEIYFAHDKDNLYFAARCFDSDFSQLHARTFEHDGATFSDDNVWLFFDTDLDLQTYWQAIINCNGAVFDRRCATDGTRDAAWNGAWEVASGLEDKAWTLEFKIAKSEFAPYNEDKWGFNMRRLQPRLGDAGYWSVPFGHAPQYFGILEFR